MKFRYKPIRYSMLMFGWRAPSREVTGYAVDTGRDDIRLCVRKVTGGWMCDHYDSGYSVNGRIYPTREDAAAIGLQKILSAIKSGQYAEAIREAEQQIERLKDKSEAAA